MNSIASMVEGGAGLAEGIRGYFQGQEGKEEMAALMKNYPKWDISKSYNDYLGTFQKLAAGNMPGYDLGKSNIESTQATAVGQAKEGALSSAQFQDTTAKLYQTSLDALTKFDIANAQYGAQAKQNLGEAQYKYGDLQVKQWDQNINRYWNIMMNMAQAKYNEGTAAVQSGVDTFVQSGFDFAGSGSGSSGSSGNSGGTSGLFG